jgi:hypothetical protein
LPPWLSPVERLAVNQSVKGPNPFDGANSNFLLRRLLFVSMFSVKETAQ